MNYFQRLIAWITRDKSYRFYQVALQFLRAETIAEKRRVVEKHPGVLSNGMRVGGMLSWTEPAIENGDHELLGLLKKNEDLLRHLFEVGKRGVSVEQALEDYELPEQNLGLLNTLIGAKTAGEKIAVLEKHSHVLLTDAFEQVIAKMVKYAEQANEAETYVQMCEIQEMLRRCREIGTKEARVEFERREQDQSFEILMAFVQAGSQAEMRQLLQQHQGLASPRIELALEKMIDTARQSGDVKHVHLFSRAQMMLREARETRKKQKTGKKQKTEKKEAFATEPPEAQLAAAMRELSQPGKSNDEYIALYQRILSLISRESHGDLWGRFHCMLAHRLLQREIPAVGQVGAIHLNSLPDNIEDVIFHYEQALEALTNEAHPDMWREAHSNLGSFYTYSAMETGNSKHQELAIRHSQEVLNVVSFEELPREWAEFHNNLGLLFCSRNAGVRADNLVQAVEHYEQALTVYTRKDSPDRWRELRDDVAGCLADHVLLLDPSLAWDLNKGQTLQTMSQPDELFQRLFRAEAADDLTTILEKYASFLLTERVEALVLALAQAQESEVARKRVGQYRRLLHRAREENTTTAVNEMVAKLAEEQSGDPLTFKQVMFMRAKPDQWPDMIRQDPELFSDAFVQLMGRALQFVPKGTAQDLVHKAEDGYLLLRRCQKSGMEEAFAEWDLRRARPDLAAVLRQLDYQINDDSEIPHRIQLYEQALALVERHDHEMLWGRLHLNLFMYLFRGVDAMVSEETMEQVLFHGEQALQVYSRETSALEWAALHVNLAACYAGRFQGDREQDIKTATEHLQNALVVFTEHNYPDEWRRYQTFLNALQKEQFNLAAHPSSAQESLEQRPSVDTDLFSEWRLRTPNQEA